MYNIVDSKFAGMISPEALTAVVKSFPLYLIIVAASVGISSGTTALISNALGEKNTKRASLLFGQSILVALFMIYARKRDNHAVHKKISLSTISRIVHKKINNKTLEFNYYEPSWDWIKK